MQVYLLYSTILPIFYICTPPNENPKFIRYVYTSRNILNIGLVGPDIFLTTLRKYGRCNHLFWGKNHLVITDHKVDLRNLEQLKSIVLIFTQNRELLSMILEMINQNIIFNGLRLFKIYNISYTIIELFEYIRIHIL